MTSLIATALIFLPIFLLLSHPFIMANSMTKSQNLFAGDLLPFIVESKSSENIVYSPASIHSSLAFMYLGANGRTADEIRQVLNLETEDKSAVAFKYGEFLKNIFYKSTKPDENKPQLKMSTRLYVSNNIKISEQFNTLARDSFGWEAENVDFSRSLTVVKKINKWVEDQTEKKIKNLLQTDAVDADTTSVLVNAIYFKAKWLRPFSALSTSKTAFHLNPNKQIEVDIMYTDDYFGYAELNDLKAKVLEIPYENSDISMMILLPNKIDGLEDLEKSLKGKDLNNISDNLVQQSVDVFLPKFRIEFNIDLKETLIKMGCSSMFTHNANLTGIFDSTAPLKISDVKHKAFLDCNEAGSEATAATFMKIVPMSLNLDKKLFRADHPFAFIIRSKNAIYFSGHVASFKN